MSDYDVISKGVDCRMIKDNLLEILNDVSKSPNVKLIAVSKTYPAEAVLEAIDAGQLLFGENRVQEAYSKFTDERVVAKNPELHIIGHLQRNKARDAVRVATMIQSIDKLETLVEIEKQCAKQEKTIDYLIEINSSGEEQKSGVYPMEVDVFIKSVLEADLQHCNLRGVMTVGPLTENPDSIRESFRLVRGIFDKLKIQLGKTDFDVVSMGMSSDYRIAIEEGSTLVRVGSAIFGKRDYS